MSMRRRYPLQNLRADGSQVNGHTATDSHVALADEDTDARVAPGRARSRKRHSYPLQELPTERYPQPKKSTVFEDSEPDPRQTARSTETHGSVRRRYPAQSTAPPSQQQHLQAGTNGYAASEGSASYSPSHTPNRVNSGRQRPYPLQTLPVDRLPRVQPSREDLLDNPSVQHTPSSFQPSENLTFEKEKRRPYPAQSLPVDKILLPKPSREVLSAELAAQSIPPAISATKHSESEPKRKGRTLVVCLDGTGDKFDGDNSNIVLLVSCLKKDDPTQITYYQAGIGTYDSSQKLSAGFSAAVDMAVGSGLGVHICDAYRFLMATYREGDRICLFGFSRGAYTARCLAGMIHKVGLLPAHNGAQVPFAYQMYKDETETGWIMSDGFKKTFCNDVRVYFIGVFDSVASVGFIPRTLPLSSNPACQSGYFRHAMALDEHRAKFKVSQYQNYDSEAVAAGLVQKTNHDSDTDVLEVWFTGCHADVGGGAVKNDERHMLSRIPLRWMIRQSFECNTGIMYSSAALAEKGLDVHTLWPRYTKLEKPAVGPSPSLMNKYEEGSLEPLSRRSTLLDPAAIDGSLSHYNPFTDDKVSNGPMSDITSEQVEDYFDALAPINDELVNKYWSWAILELLPIKVRILAGHQSSPSSRSVMSGGEDVWVKKIRPNLGRYRAVMKREPNLHWTVRQRMQDKGYKIKVRTGGQVGWNVMV